MIGKLIERPIAVTMSIIAIIVLGAVAIGLLPVSLMPDVDIPQITVQVSQELFIELVQSETDKAK